MQSHTESENLPARLDFRQKFALMLGAPVRRSFPSPRDAVASMLCCGLAFLALTWLCDFLHGSEGIMIIASFGASSILVLGTPGAAYGQPRNVICGNMLSALAGVTAFHILGESNAGAALAVGLAAFLMHMTDTMHPPGGACALLAVIGGPEIRHLGYGYVLLPVGAGSLLLVLMGLFINNLVRRRPYPLHW